MRSSSRPIPRREGEQDLHRRGGRAADVQGRRLQGLRALRARAPRRLRVGERSRRPPHVRTGPGDLEEGAAHLQRHRRLGQAHEEAGRQRVVHDRRLPPRQRRRRRLLFGSKSRGCGGVAVFAGDKPAVSRNFVTSRVLAQGPIRVVFELGYAPFEAGANGKVTETKRITLDAGSNFNRIASTFKVEGGGPTLASASASASTRAPTSRPTSTGCGRGSRCPTTRQPRLRRRPPRGNGGDDSPHRPRHVHRRQGHPRRSLRLLHGLRLEQARRASRDAGAWTKALQDQARDIASPVKVTLSAKK